MRSSYDVVIVGAGPAGLSAARALVEAGVPHVLVLERNPEAGGLPRLCGHLGWGLFDHHRLWTGPVYARQLVRHAAGAEIVTGATVTGIEEGRRVRVSTREGVRTLEACAILLATGIRETPRGSRLVTGTRPWGVTTTGAFQDLVYAGGLRLFRRPVIVGSEVVAFSALVTARHAGIQPVAMIEENRRTTARRPGGLVARVAFGVPVWTATTVVSIEGRERVEGVTVEHAGRRETIGCDGVIFSGRFQPEIGALLGGGVAVDPATGGPAIDNFWRCSDPAVFAAGNVLRAVEHSGFAAREGREAAAAILQSLRSGLPSPSAGVAVRPSGALKYIYPQRLIANAWPLTLHGRASMPLSGTLRLMFGDRVLAERRVAALPERRLTITVSGSALQSALASGAGQDDHIEAVLA